MRLYRELFIRLGRARWFSWLSIHLLVPIDRFCYRRSGGRFSLLHFGRRRKPALQTLLLSTRGRKTGHPRTTPVLYLEDDGRLVVVASNFGRDRHPAWSANLLPTPSGRPESRPPTERAAAQLLVDAAVGSHEAGLPPGPQIGSADALISDAAWTPRR